MTLAWRNREEVRRWFKFSDVLEAEQHREWFDRYKDEDGNYVWIVEEREQGRPVGQVSLYKLDRRRGEAEVGRFIAAPGCEGRGYMKAAIVTMMRWAFDALAVSRLYLEVFADNVNAIALYRKCGFADISSEGGMLNMQAGDPAGASSWV